MREHRLEVADVFREPREEFLELWGDTLSSPQRKALRDIGACRTAALGGHVEECDQCAHRLIAYNSCRNRHCPKCQSTARDQWLAERAKELLPVPYCHAVFTIPERLAPLTLQNQRVCYSLLFRAVSETLQQIAADTRHLGAKIGFLAVLHTWSQNLLHHPHVHCVVPAGGFVSRRSSMDSLPPEVLSARAGLEQTVSWEIAGLVAPGFQRRQAGMLRAVSRSCRACSIPCVASEIKEDRVGCVRQTAVRRTGARLEVPRPRYAPSGHLQQSPAVVRPWPGHFSVARLQTRQSHQVDDP